MVLEGSIIPREFYLKDTLCAAKEIVGCCIAVLKKPVCAAEIVLQGKVRLDESILSSCGRIVETEAYLGFSDKACHSYKANPKGRTNIMYNKGGYAYIYLIYGMYCCFNIVTREEGCPQAVLVRALEPLDSADNAKRYSGPGKLCRETGITRADYGADLCGEVPSRILLIKPDNFGTPEIVSAKRIGVEYSEEAADFLYRFYDKNSPSVSKR